MWYNRSFKIRLLFFLGLYVCVCVCSDVLVLYLCKSNSSGAMYVRARVFLQDFGGGPTSGWLIFKNMYFLNGF